jgi:hypothetical protein
LSGLIDFHKTHFKRLQNGGEYFVPSENNRVNADDGLERLLHHHGDFESVEMAVSYRVPS